MKATVPAVPDHAIGLVGEAYATAVDVVLEEDWGNLHSQSFG